MAITAITFAEYANSQTDIAINYAERRFFKHINSLGRDVEKYLSGVKRIDNLSKPKIDSLIAQIVGLSEGRYASAVEGFISDAALLAEYSAASEVAALGAPKKLAQAYKKASKHAIQANGLFIDEHMAQLVAYNNERLVKTIRQGWASKIATDELSALIVGTEKVRQADGLMYKQKLSARAAIDTASHHISQNARAEARAENNIFKYRIVATLDRRTSETCRELDSKVFTYGAPDARVPPFHYFCRTVIVPELDKEYSWLSEGRTRSSAYGSVDSSISYKEWAEQNKDKLAADDEAARLLRNKRARRKRAQENN